MTSITNVPNCPLNQQCPDSVSFLTKIAGDCFYTVENIPKSISVRAPHAGELTVLPRPLAGLLVRRGVAAPPRTQPPPRPFGPAHSLRPETPQKYILIMAFSSVVGEYLLVQFYLWSPYVIGQTIIFSCCFFFLLLLFFPRLISAVGGWMFTILYHMVWP